MSKNKQKKQKTKTPKQPYQPKTNFGKGFASEFENPLNKPRAYAQQQKEKGKAKQTLAKQHLFSAGSSLAQGRLVAMDRSLQKATESFGRGSLQRIWGTVLKGIFNHPDWYMYDNTLPIPAYNATRPYDPASLRNILGKTSSTGNTIAPGIGVSHFVVNNCVFDKGIHESEAFKLATIEAFQSMRKALRSNLSYSLDDFRDYFLAVMSLLTQCKSYERLLFWSNAAKGDIPELLKAIRSAPANYTEQGRVSSVAIASLQDDGFTELVVNYNKLRSIAAQISVPRNLAEYISWWLGSTFIDQAAPNPQLYVNLMRRCPQYNYADNTLVQVGDFDIVTSSISDTIEQALAILEVNAVLIADMQRTENFGVIELPAYDAAASFEPIVLHDYEMLTIMLNSYTAAQGSRQNLMTPDVLRVDVLEQVSNANVVGVVNAAAAWAAYPVPISIRSQAAFITVPAGARVQNNLTGLFTAGQPLSQWQSQLYPEGTALWIQTTGSVIENNSVDVLSSILEATITADATVKLPPSFDFSDEFDIYSSSAASVYWTGNSHNPGGYKIAGSPDAEESLWVAVKTVAPLKLALYIQPNGLVAFDRSKATLVSSELNAIATWTNTAAGGRYSVARVGDEPLCTISSSYADRVLKFWMIGSTILSSGFANVAKFVVPTQAGEKYVSVNHESAWWMPWFTNNVDYHIPVQYSTTSRVTENNDVIEHFTTYKQLAKHTYIPFTLYKPDVEAVLYWMYLGLFTG